MEDTLVRALAYNGSVRVSAVVDTHLVQEASKRHDTYPVATAALGRSLSSALLLSWGLKGEGLITLRIMGDGPLGAIVVTANAEHTVRGYVQEPHIDLPLNDKGKLAVGQAVGEGYLHVTKDIGLKEAYTGTVPLVSGEIGDDVASYLLQSEQTPSLVAVGVLVAPDHSVAASGGIIIQAMPDCPEETLAVIEENLTKVKPVSTLVKEGASPETLISHFLPETDIQYLEKTPVSFKCSCNREKISGLLKSLGSEELEDILAKEGKSEVICHFCNQPYYFERSDLELLLAEITNEKN